MKTEERFPYFIFLRAERLQIAIIFCFIIFRYLGLGK